MAIKRDYYDVLGVPREASDEEIKRAFRRLAQRHHPDIDTSHGAEERFKELNEAYRVLSDRQRRSAYDMFGHAGVDGASGGGFEGFGGGFGPVGDIFDAFFGGSPTGTRQRRRVVAGADLRYDLTIEFAEAISGVTAEVKFPTLVTCDVCAGSGGEPGTEPERCPECNGTGERRLRQDRSLQVTVPPGIDSGQRIALEGQGESGPRGGPPGDLYVVVTVKDHPQLLRRGTELYHELLATFPQAALGATLAVPTVEGSEEVTVPPGTQSG